MLEINHGMKVLRFVGYREVIDIGQYYLDTFGKIVEELDGAKFHGCKAVFEAKPITYCFDGVWFKQGDMETVEVGHWYLDRINHTPFLARMNQMDKSRRLISFTVDGDGGSQAVPESMTVTVTAPDTGMIVSNE